MRTDGGAAHNGAGCLKKSVQAAALPPDERREIVRMRASDYPVQMLCEIIDLPASTYAERFMRTLKEVEVSLNEYEDLADARVP